MTVSVVIPVLNEAEYLPRCLQALKDHAGDLVCEIFVVDAGSSDDTVALARQANVLVLLKTNSTIAGQRNMGAEAASGDLIAFLDADCTIEPGWAEAAINHFDDHTIVSVGAPPEIPGLDNTWVQKTWSFLKRKPNSNVRDVSWMASANVWVRKSSFEKIGGFDESFETCEDADLGFRLKEIGRIISDPKVRVQHHREPRTLVQFYKKELWHGKHSYDGIMKGRYTPSELPSLVTPILFSGSLLVVLIGLMLWNTTSLWIVVVGLFGVVCSPVVYTFRAVIQKGHWIGFPQCLVVYFVYFAARADAFVRWLLRCAFVRMHR